MKILHLLFFFYDVFISKIVNPSSAGDFPFSAGELEIGSESWRLASMSLLLEKLCLDAKSPLLYSVYGRKLSLRLVQLNLVSLGTKGNYNEGKEVYLAIVLVCKLSCSCWWIERGRVATVF